MGCICLPIVLVFRLGAYIVMGLFAIVAYIIYAPISAAVTFCRYNRAAPVVTRAKFYYWLHRNGFTSEELNKVKDATKNMKMHAIVHKLTDVRAVEEFFKLQSIEKQKLVIVVLQQSKEAIDQKHQKQFEKLRTVYTGAIFSWGARDAYRLGDMIAKNGRMCSRGEGDRKKADWEKRVASKVNLRINAVLRCINTIASEGRYAKHDARMKDLVRTVNRSNTSVDWEDFADKNKRHDNRLLGEIHTAATFVKQFVTQAIVTESYSSRVARICWSWTLLLMLISLKLAKLIVHLDIDSASDIVDLIVGSITKIAEAPEDLLGMLENGGMPTGGSGGPGTNADDSTGSMLNTLNDKFGRQARLDNKAAQLKESMKVEEVTELAEDQNPTVSKN
ncbi:hypothetical protein PR001_g4752 [Phytophthora rubi]|nr:hypothetical protein PR001_g4752 [Phytophthora rubi]